VAPKAALSSIEKDQYQWKSRAEVDRPGSKVGRPGGRGGGGGLRIFPDERRTPKFLCGAFKVG